MKNITLSFIAFIFLIFSSCGEKAKEKGSYEEIKKLSWLEGRWENNSDEGNLSETWEKINDSTYIGQAFFITGKDTLHQESLELLQKGDTVTYSPTVLGQNNNQPIQFKMTSWSENQVVFENPSHDYPKKIIYHKITNDSLVAEISGMQQGKSSVEKYPMKKK